jgi:lipopolysaccharide export system protein LptA
MESQGNVKFKSSKGAEGEGQKINFSLKNNLIEVFGENSFLIMNDLKMISDRFIKIDDTKGEFFLEGKNSKLETEDKIIVGNNIKGTYEKINEQNEIISLNATVEDGGLVEITTKTLKMFSLKAIYSKKDNIIELFDSVKVIRNNETIVGDYAKVNTLDESYKVTSYNTNKVKVLIDNTNE